MVPGLSALTNVKYIQTFCHSTLSITSPIFVSVDTKELVLLQSSNSKFNSNSNISRVFHQEELINYQFSKRKNEEKINSDNLIFQYIPLSFI